MFQTARYEYRVLCTVEARYLPRSRTVGGSVGRYLDTDTAFYGSRLTYCLSYPTLGR